MSLLHPEVRSRVRQGKQSPEAYALKGSAKRQCLYGTALEKEGTQPHMEDSVNSTVSSSWVLSASQDVSVWKKTSPSFASLAHSHTNCTKLAYIYFIITISSYLVCSKCILDFLCCCLQLLRSAIISVCSLCISSLVLSHYIGKFPISVSQNNVKEKAV